MGHVKVINVLHLFKLIEVFKFAMLAAFAQDSRIS